MIYARFLVLLQQHDVFREVKLRTPISCIKFVCVNNDVMSLVTRDYPKKR